jgi:uncharacterized damage-inducible protein DinB
MTVPSNPEPWLRQTKSDVPAVYRAVLDALLLAEEDLTRWCADLTSEEFNARPGGIASVAFHLRHIARSVDRLLTYAEEQSLSDEQTIRLKDELNPDAELTPVFAELSSALVQARARVRALVGRDLEGARTVGTQRLPTSLGGVLVHIADHTQRHVGQAITTAKIVLASRRG